MVKIDLFFKPLCTISGFLTLSILRLVKKILLNYNFLTNPVIKRAIPKRERGSKELGLSVELPAGWMRTFGMYAKIYVYVYV